MADRVTLEGNYPTGEVFKFTLDGASTYDQMQRLIDLTATMAAKFSKRDPEERKRIEELRTNTAEIEKSTEAVEDLGFKVDTTGKAINALNSVTQVFSGNLTALSTIMRDVKDPFIQAGTASLTMAKALLNYSDWLRPALQRGIGGAVLDFAVYAKSAGMSMENFSKLLEASGGAFTQLGDTPNQAAKNFAVLINEVRAATESTGNLGMSQMELAGWTTEQLKIAVFQNMRGKAAQDRVISVSKELSEQFQELAQRTGKSTKELAEYAAKLVMDPTISNFIATMAKGGDDVSKAMQVFGSSMGALFAKQGEELANVAAKTAVAGVPLFTDALGAEIFRVMPNFYQNLQEISRKARLGIELKPDELKAFKRSFESEYEYRQKWLAFMEATGTAEQKAAVARVQAMYQQSRNYNEAEIRRRRQQADAAQKFNAEVNKLRATLHQLTVPFLEMLNTIDWAGVMSILTGAAGAVKFIVEFLINPLAKAVEGSKFGEIFGFLLGLGAVASVLLSAFKILTKVITPLAGLFSGLGAALGKALGALGIGGGIAGALGGLKAKSVSIDGGYGTLPIKPLFVMIVGRAGRGGVVPLPGPGGPGAPGPGKPGGGKPTMGQRLGSVLKGRLGIGIGLLGAGWAGGMLEESGEKTLEKDPNSLWGKIKEVTGSIVGAAATWAGVILFASDIIKTFFPKLGGYILTFGSFLLEKGLRFGAGLLEILGKVGSWVSRIFPELMTMLRNFGSTLFGWLSKLLSGAGGVTGLLKGAKGAVAAGIGGFAIDWAAGKLGVGKDKEGNDIKINEKQDDKNWERMNFWQKMESGLARSFEFAGKLLFLDNLVRESEAARIRDETEYLDSKKELEATSAAAAKDKEKADKEVTEQLKLLNEHMENVADGTRMNNSMASRHVMTAETQERLVRILANRPA